MSKISNQDFYWLVGLLEGEGCFAYGGRWSSDVHITVEMADEDIINRVARLFEQLADQEVNVREKSRKNAKWSRTYVANIGGHNARDIMRKLAKHMGFRRRKRIWQCLNGYNEPKSDMTAADIVKLVKNG